MQTLPTGHILPSAIRENSQHGFLSLNNPKVGCSSFKSILTTP